LQGLCMNLHPKTFYLAVSLAAKGHTEALRVMKTTFTTDDFKAALRKTDTLRWWTPVHVAAKGGHTMTLEFMATALSRAEFKEALWKTDIDKETPVHRAAEGGHTEALQFMATALLSRAEFREALRKTDKFGGTPVNMAAVYSHSEALEFMATALSRAEFKEALWKTDIDKKISIHKVTSIAELTSAQAGTVTEIEITEELGQDECQQLIEALGKHKHSVTRMNLHPKTLVLAVSLAARGHTEALQFMAMTIAVPAEFAAVVKRMVDSVADGGNIEVLRVIAAAVPDEFKKAVSQPEPDFMQMTPVHKAAEGGHTEALEFMATHAPDAFKATLMQPNYWRIRTTPVHKAAATGNIEVLRVMAAHAPDEFKKAMSQPDFMQMTPVHQAAEGGHTEALEFMATFFTTDKFKEALVQSDRLGFTPVYMAAKGGHTKTLKFIASRAKDKFKEAVRQGGLYGLSVQTPFYMAATEGHTEALKFMATEVPAEFKEALRQPDSDNKTVVHKAAEAGHTEILKFMATEAPAEFKEALRQEDHSEQDRLKQVTKRSTQLKALLELRPEWTLARTLIHMATEGGHTEDLRVIATHATDEFKEALSQPDRTEWRYQAQYQSWLTLEKSRENSPERTLAWNLIHKAAATGNIEVLRVMAAHATDEFKAALRLPDKEGRTLVDWAATEGHVNTLRFVLEEFPEQFQPGRAVEGHNLLMLFALRNNAIAVETLLKVDLDSVLDLVKLQDQFGHTAIMWAMRKGNVEAVNALVKPLSEQQCAEVLRLKDLNGKTAAVHALEQGVKLSEQAQALEEQAAELLTNAQSQNLGAKQARILAEITQTRAREVRNEAPADTQVREDANAAVNQAQINLGLAITEEEQAAAALAQAPGQAAKLNDKAASQRQASDNCLNTILPVLLARAPESLDLSTVDPTFIEELINELPLSIVQLHSQYFTKAVFLNLEKLAFKIVPVSKQPTHEIDLTHWASIAKILQTKLPTNAFTEDETQFLKALAPRVTGEIKDSRQALRDIPSSSTHARLAYSLLNGTPYERVRSLVTRVNHGFQSVAASGSPGLLLSQQATSAVYQKVLDKDTNLKRAKYASGTLDDLMKEVEKKHIGVAALKTWQDFKASLAEALNPVHEQMQGLLAQIADEIKLIQTIQERHRDGRPVDPHQQASLENFIIALSALERELQAPESRSLDEALEGVEAESSCPKGEGWIRVKKRLIEAHQAEQTASKKVTPPSSSSSGAGS